MAVTTGQLNGHKCHVLHIDRPEPGMTWKHSTEKATAEIETSGGDGDGIVVIHGRPLAEHPDYGSAITCALAKTGASVYVGEPSSMGSGVARCVHVGRANDHVVGGRHWYSHGQSQEEVRIGHAGALLWRSVRPGFRLDHEHQVLVSSRQSLIDGVLDNLEQRIGKAQADGTRMRATLVNGPDETHERLAGFWKRVLEALGAWHTETPGSMLALRRETAPIGAETASPTTGHETVQELEERAINAQQRYWRGEPKPGETLLVVNEFDTWYRQCSEAAEEWALQRHLQNSSGFIILGCASEWPANQQASGQSSARITVRRIE